jgi:hypothetical protein
MSMHLLQECIVRKKNRSFQNSENQTFLPYKNPKKNLQTEKIISKKMRVGNKFYGAVVTTTVGMFLLCIYI